MALGYVTTPNDYWIAPNAVSIILNALGDENRIYGSVASGAVIMCWIDGIDGLGYDNSHQYKTWPLLLSPTYFNSSTIKYVYAAIPRTNSIGSRAIIVFPSEKLDIYGKNESEEQKGSASYYYIFLQGIISEPSGGERRWLNGITDWGQLSTNEAIDAKNKESEWYSYSNVSGIVTLLKNLRMKVGTTFLNLFLGEDHSELKSVANSETPVDSETAVVTPSYCLSKKREDAATETIGFKKGLWVKAKEAFGFDGNGNIAASLVYAVRGIIGKLSSPNYQGGDMTGRGWQLTDDDGAGNSRLEVDTIVARMKFVASILETRKYVSMGGNYVFSPAAGVIEQVDYVRDTKDDGGTVRREMIGYSYEKVPWLIRLAPMRLKNFLLSRTRKTKRKARRSDADIHTATFFRCYLKSDDGTTATINTWQVGMLVRCQTFDVEKSEWGTHTDGTFTGAVQNTFYWREIVAVGKGRMPIDDGYEHHYIDLSNETDHYLENSDIPSPGDNIVCFGSTKKDTSHFIVIETVGTDAPALKEYRGVGLVNIHRDNNSEGHTDELPNFNFGACRRTMISPTSGNEFFAPRYYIETDDSTEQLYNEHFRGTAEYYLERASEATPTPEGSLGERLIVQDNIEHRPRLYRSVKKTEESTPRWIEETVRYGDIWHCAQTGRVYVAQATSWEDRGDYIVKTQFKQEVMGDTERSIATSMGFTDPVSGDPQWANVAEYIRSSTANISRLTSIASNGKNLLSGVLTGSGWTKGDGLAVSIVNNMIWSDDGKIVSPALKTETGEITFSFYCSEGEVSEVEVYEANSLETPIETCSVVNTGEREGSYLRYSAVLQGGYQGTVRVSVGGTAQEVHIRYPQLEHGSAATEFAASEREMSSSISQTAEKISLQVKNDLNSTGIDIEQGKIQMTADNFEIWNNDKTKKTFFVDDEGNLQSAGNASFNGTIRAKDFFVSSTFLSDADEKVYALLDATNFRECVEIEESFTTEERTYLNSITPGTLVSKKEFNYLFNLLQEHQMADGDDIYESCGWIRCTGYAQKVFAIYNNRGGSAQTAIVYLPAPELVPGKMVEVYNHTGLNAVVKSVDTEADYPTDMSGNGKKIFVQVFRSGTYFGVYVDNGKITTTYSADGVTEFRNIAHGYKETYLSLQVYISGTQYYVWAFIDKTQIF